MFPIFIDLIPSLASFRLRFAFGSDRLYLNSENIFICKTLPSSMQKEYLTCKTWTRTHHSHRIRLRVRCPLFWVFASKAFAVVCPLLVTAMLLLSPSRGCRFLERSPHTSFGPDYWITLVCTSERERISHFRHVPSTPNLTWYVDVWRTCFRVVVGQDSGTAFELEAPSPSFTTPLLLP